jgi:hypothetical protein
MKIMDKEKEITFNDVPDVLAEIKQELEEIKAAQNQPQQEKEEQYLTRNELKSKLKIGSTNTIVRLEKENVLNPVRVGRKLLYKQSEIDKITGSIEE